jgi:hypothetical protein
MASVNTIIKEIEEQKVGNSSKRVLLVEGVDDICAVTAFLDRGKPEWESEWVIADAQGKRNVLAVLDKKPSWLGIVDRDEWSEDVIADTVRNYPNLWVLPRFCIDNYLIVPAELWAALPPNQQEKVGGGKDELTTRIVVDLDKWVSHGVLWSVINPLWSGLRALGFKEELLNPDIVQDEDKIKETLNKWHGHLNPDHLWERYTIKLDEVSLLDNDEKLKHWVHGKKIYETVINPLLDELLGQKSAKERKRSIFRTLLLPDEVAGLFEKMAQIVDSQ